MKSFENSGAFSGGKKDIAGTCSDFPLGWEGGPPGGGGGSYGGAGNDGWSGGFGAGGLVRVWWADSNGDPTWIETGGNYQ